MPRDGKELIDATRPFAVESPAKSAWAVLSSLTASLVLTASILVVRPWPPRLALSILSGLFVVRVFVLFHDAKHGAILRKSPVLRALLDAYAMLTLTPPRVWKDTHNYHHAHNAKIVGSHVGSFPVVTPSLWAKMSTKHRRAYALVRSPLTIACAYVTLFAWGMCLAPFLRSPRKNVQGLVALVVHAALVGVLVVTFDVATYVFVLGLPLAIATAMGGYLFYAQHNFPGAKLQPRESWSYTKAALESSSFMRTGPVMAYFTADIGYHHVHHLNPQIPFYRLREAMANVPELGHPTETSLRLRDVLACLRLGMWNPDRGAFDTWDTIAEDEAAGVSGQTPAVEAISSPSLSSHETLQAEARVRP
ncbi:MAG: fatty acid desaturase [Polyangiaceae bacterium]